MQVEIDLNNKEKAAEEIKKIQKAIDDLIGVCKSQEQQLKDNVKVINEAEEHINTLQKTAVDLSDALKAVHRILQSKKEMFGTDKEIKELLDMLATFVVSSGAIKLGVISHAQDQEGQNESKDA